VLIGSKIVLRLFSDGWHCLKERFDSPQKAQNTQKGCDPFCVLCAFCGFQKLS
jgi:hypothetical protein